MARFSMRSFLVRARQALEKSLAGKGSGQTSFVIGNESADLDSITCALVYAYIQSSLPSSRKLDKYWIPVTNIPSAELSLRPELTALLRPADLKLKDLITLDDMNGISKKLSARDTDWTLVDHNVLQGELGKQYCSSITGVIDHHEDENKVPLDASPRVIEKSGSCSSLVANHCRGNWETVSDLATNIWAAHGQEELLVDDLAYTSTWDAQVAKLSLASILIDTHNLKSEDKVTDHDRKAVRYLEAKIGLSRKISPSYDRDAFFEEIGAAKSDLNDLNFGDLLRKDYKQWTDGELTLGMASCVRSIDFIKGKSEAFFDDLMKFAVSRNLDLVAIGTSHDENTQFERQLLLIAAKEGTPVEVTNVFERAYAQELKLEAGLSESDFAGRPPPWFRQWEQKNIAASRKQVAPLLRACMRREN